jgi:hypothetical protein
LSFSPFIIVSPVIIFTLPASLHLLTLTLTLTFTAQARTIRTGPGRVAGTGLGTRPPNKTNHVSTTCSDMHRATDVTTRYRGLLKKP